MPTDHPDGTRPIVISRADIQAPIDLQHQTINLKTNFKEQEVGVFLKPDWETKEGHQVPLVGDAFDQARGGAVQKVYTVTTGKTLYITHFSGAMVATDAADGDKNQICYGYIWNKTDDKMFAYIGGNGGFTTSFPAPIKIPAGKEVRFILYNYSNHTCTCRVSAEGYEI